MRSDSPPTFQLPRPGKVVLVTMGVLLGVWVVFSLGINFFHMPEGLFFLLTGNSEAIRAGQIWRLVTAGLVHQPFGVGAAQTILFVLLGIYFMAPALESRWGGQRLLTFMIATVVVAYGGQFLVELILPVSVVGVIGGRDYFGFFPVVEALAVAWALSNRDKQVLLLVLPVSAMTLIWIMIGYNLLLIISKTLPTEGGIAPFGGMLAGWAFGSGNPTPARRLLLTLRYRWLSTRAARQRRGQGSGPVLRVIEGEGGPSESGGRKRPPTDKRFLN